MDRDDSDDMKTPVEALRPDDVPFAAMPSQGARIAAFAAIVLGGVCGGLIGFAITDLQTDGGLAAAIGGIIGATFAAGGVAIVAVLSLRAMTEWKTVDERREMRERARRDR